MDDIELNTEADVNKTADHIQYNDNNPAKVAAA